MAAGLGIGLAVFLAGLGVVFAGARFRGRLAGLAGMALGALLAVVAAPPRPSWLAAATVAVTLVPLLVIALLLHRRLAARSGRSDSSLDDDPW